MWASTAPDYNFNLSNYSPANNTSASFFANSFSSDNDTKMNDSNFSQFQHQLAMSLTGGFPFMSSGSQSSPSCTTDSPHLRAKKKPNPVPVEKKTHAYFERRKKNNQSAQKSRNERRRREQENMLRIGQLEQENNVLRSMVQQLQSKVNFQDLQLQTRTQQHVNPQPNTTNTALDRQPNVSACNASQVPFTNQMNMMLMNSY